jgi:hypothetical protein
MIIGRSTEERRRRSWLVALLPFALGALLAGCSWGAPPVPWEKLESAARTFPVPEGFTRGEPQRDGRYCGPLEPTCETPRLGMVVTLEEPDVSVPAGDICQVLAESVDDWSTRGLEDVEFQSDFGDCVYFGTVNGFRVQAESAPGESAIGVVVFG